MKANNTISAKVLTVKRSDWSETARRLECSGWYYIGTPTATGKTIYRRDNSEIEIIIEEEPNSTPTTMNANGTLATLPATAVRVAAANLLPAKYFDEDFTPETANVEYLRSMLEDYVFEYDITPAQLNEAANRRPRIFKTSKAI